MTGSTAPRAPRAGKAKTEKEILFDRELEDLPPDLRWREWMLRIEAVIFASAEPVTRETLARIVGKDCSIDLLIDDLKEDLHGRPYEIVAVAGGFTDRANRRIVRVSRTVGGKLYESRMPVTQPIRPGDTIYVPESLF